MNTACNPGGVTLPAVEYLADGTSAARQLVPPSPAASARWIWYVVTIPKSGVMN